MTEPVAPRRDVKILVRASSSIAEEIGHAGLFSGGEALVLPAAVNGKQAVRSAVSRCVFVRFQFTRRDIASNSLLESGSHQIVLVEIDDMHRVRDRKFAVPLNDQKVLVVAVGGLVSQVVAASYDSAVLLVQGIDHNDLVVDDRVPRGEELGPEVAERDSDRCRANDRDFALISSRPPDRWRRQLDGAFFLTGGLCGRFVLG